MSEHESTPSPQIGEPGITVSVWRHLKWTEKRGWQVSETKTTVTAATGCTLDADGLDVGFAIERVMNTLDRADAELFNRGHAEAERRNPGDVVRMPVGLVCENPDREGWAS